MTGVSGRRGWSVLIPAHGAAVLRRESSSDIEVAVFIEYYGPVNLAARTIELYLSTLLGNLQNNVFAAPRPRCNGTGIRRGLHAGLKQNAG